MKEIILIEQRSFSFADFREFEIGGKKLSNEAWSLQE
jgi:hypothetical protein